jgi:tellurite resistance-related uncharacterized protein
MTEPTIPARFVEARRTPLFDAESLPDTLLRSHRTAVWAKLHVRDGTVRYIDLGGESRRDIRLAPGDTAVIRPGVEHKIEPSPDAKFFVQFYRPGADPGRPPAPDAKKPL